MSTMSCLRRKLTASREGRVVNVNRRRAIKLEQAKPDYGKASKDEKRSRIGGILRRFRLTLRAK